MAKSFFKREKGVSYTDMCKWFDNNFYTNNREEDRAYKYIYLLLYMLAAKSHYFYKSSEYENFALYGAGIIFNRILKKEKNNEKIKNLLDYLKGSLFGLKCSYYVDTFNEVSPRGESAEGYKTSLQTSIQSEYLEQANVDIIKIINTSLTHFKDLIYNDIKLKNLSLREKEVYYINFLLSLENIFTLTSKEQIFLADVDIAYITKYNNLLIKRCEMFNNPKITHYKVYEENNSFDLILKQYIGLYKEYLINEINETRLYYQLDNITFDNILGTAYERNYLPDEEIND